MARRNPLRRRINILVFIVIIAVSGYALSASGNLNDPFRVFSDISSLVTSGDQGRPGSGELAIDRAGASGGETRPEPPSGGFEGGRESAGETTIQWSEIGGVLFNAWFIAAMAAAMIVIGPIVGFVIKQIRRGTHRVTLHRATA